MFEAFAKACTQLSVPLRFILTSKVMHPRLQEKVESIIIENKLNERVIFKGLISKEEVDELKQNCSMVVINKPSNWQNDYNFPSKLAEILITGVPVIASSTGEIGSFLKDYETGFIVPANDIAAIAEKIIYIINNPEIAHKIGQNGKKLAIGKFYYMNYADELSDFFKNVAN
jgi:glycosyltransferase involved in cell wall biosynthesis